MLFGIGSCHAEGVSQKSCCDPTLAGVEGLLISCYFIMLNVQYANGYVWTGPQDSLVLGISKAPRRRISIVRFLDVPDAAADDATGTKGLYNWLMSSSHVKINSSATGYCPQAACL